MSASSAACTGFQKVGGVAVPGEDHVAYMVCDDGIGMCGGIVQKLWWTNVLVFGVGLACCVARDLCAGSMVLWTQRA